MSTPTCKQHPRSKFSPLEDQQLKILVAKFGPTNWEALAAFIPGRNARQVHDRWVNYLSPNVNKGPWTPEEDARLIELYQQYGPKWMRISKHLPNRSDTAIKSRWMVMKRHEKRIEIIQQYQHTQTSEPDFYTDEFESFQTFIDDFSWSSPMDTFNINEIEIAL